MHHGLGIHFFDELINEKIITVNPITQNGEEKNIVYIAYELFEEYITAKKIIEANKVHTYTKARDLEDFFSDQNRYFHLLSDRRSNQGIFEALAVQIPVITSYSIHYTKLYELGGFVERLRRLNNVALVMSVRDTYEDDIIPEGFYRRNNVNKYKFEGFDDLDQAIQEFFNYYQVPLVLNDYLKYEFQNPLFLKMYCMAYDQVNRSGTESIEGIFNNYFKKINENLKLRIENYPKFGNLVVEALYYFIDAKLKHKGIV